MSKNFWTGIWPFWPLVPSDLSFERREAAADALSDPYYTNVVDATVPEYVLSQVKAIVDLKLASMRALEGKAAQFVGFGGTVIALVGVFGRNVPGVLLHITVGLLLVSIVLNLKGMAIREDDLPSPSLYNTARVAENLVNKARIAMALAEAYTGYSLDLQREAGIKALWINSGSLVFISGLIALFFVTFTPAPSPQQHQQGATLDCRRGHHNARATHGAPTGSPTSTPHAPS